MAESLAPASKVQSKSLTCAVCREVYNSPRFLPCFHSFCLSCLEGLAAASGASSFLCPSCRKSTSIPPDGVQAFQANFYITDDEMERARRGVNATVCPAHSLELEPLAFLCTDCDRMICIRCKLTEHENHKTEDLARAAERCKKGLTEKENPVQQAVNSLQDTLDQVKENIHASQENRETIKDKVRVQYDGLVAMAAAWRDSLLNNVDDVADEIEDQLIDEKIDLQSELHSLGNLFQRFQHVCDNKTDVEVLEIDHEMRQGAGRQEVLCKAEKCVVARTSTFVGLDTDLDLDRKIESLEEFYRFFKCSVKKVTCESDSASDKEIISRVFLCGEDGESRAVHALCAHDSKVVEAAYGHTPSGNIIKRVSFNQVAKNMDDHKEVNGKITYKRYGFSDSYYAPYDCNNKFELNSKSASMLNIVNDHHDDTSRVQRTRIKTSTKEDFKVVEKKIFSLNASQPYAFDANSNQQLFALIVDDPTAASLQGSRLATRLVRVYRRGEPDPITTYRPPNPQNFHPVDVCFWRRGCGERLVIADYDSGKVHVINLQNDLCVFERYLLSGNELVRRPTAFDTDVLGNLWIGFSNGWVFKCEPSLTEEERDESNLSSEQKLYSSEDEELSTEEEEVEEEDDAEEEFSSGQDGIYALGTTHARSAPSFRSFFSVILEMVPMFVWLKRALSQLFSVDQTNT